MTKQTTQTLTEALATIGVSHRKSSHDGCQELLTQAGDIITFCDAFHGWAFVAEANSAA